MSIYSTRNLFNKISRCSLFICGEVVAGCIFIYDTYIYIHINMYQYIDELHVREKYISYLLFVGKVVPGCIFIPVIQKNGSTFITLSFFFLE